MSNYIIPQRYGDHTHSLVPSAVGYSTINDIVRSTYSPTITDNIYRTSPLITALEAPAMTIEAKIARERREERERREIEALYAFYDEANFDPEIGDVVSFSWQPKDTTYHYAAIFTEVGWAITGQETRTYDTFAFVDWLVAKRIRCSDVHWMTVVTE